MDLFIHVPKTGGATFLNVLQSVYGDSYFYHPGSQYNCFEDDRFEVPKSARIIAGHYRSDFYDTEYPDARKITILRDPVERFMSDYWFVRGTPFDIPDGHYGKEAQLLREGKMTPEDWIEVPWRADIIPAYIVPGSLPEFSFVGLHELWDQSMQLFFCMFNDSQWVPILNLNKNMNKKTVRYEMPSRQRKRLAAKLYKDYEVYDTAVSLWWDRISRVLVNRNLGNLT